MSRILLLDCYVDGAGGAPNFLPALRGRNADVVRVIRGELPVSLTNYSAVVITGSAASVTDSPPWLDGLEQLVRECAREERPLLGVCFGHQVIATALYGRDAVFVRPRIEVGWNRVKLLAADPLFDCISDGQHLFMSHYDEVRPDLRSNPELGLESPIWTAMSDECPTHGLRVPGLPIWGVQFHAEMPVEEAVGLIRSRSVSKPEHYPDPEGTIAGAVATPEIWQRLVDNFFAASGLPLA